jgi:hypothetical protein
LIENGRYIIRIISGRNFDLLQTCIHLDLPSFPGSVIDDVHLWRTFTCETTDLAHQVVTCMVGGPDFDLLQTWIHLDLPSFLGSVTDDVHLRILITHKTADLAHTVTNGQHGNSDA